MLTTENIARQLLSPHLAARPDKIAFILGGRTLSYRQLCEGSYRFASQLQAEGIPVGSRAAIVLPDCFALIQSFLGCILAGVVPVLSNPAAPGEDIAFMLDDIDAALLITRPDSAAVKAAKPGVRIQPVSDDQAFDDMLAAQTAEAQVNQPHESDIAFMLYTSGSTGEPKGVPHRHGDIPFTIEAFDGYVTQMTENDLVFCVSKLFFTYGLECSLCFPINIGATAILLPDRPTPEEILRTLERYRPSLFFCVPTLYNLLLQTVVDAAPFQSLRMTISAGEVLPESLCTEWHAMTGLELFDCMGSTETLSSFLANRAGENMPGSSGRLIAPFEAKIIDGDGQAVAQGEAGELLVRGGSIAPYYWNRPEETAKTMLADGWLRTGDVYIERDGYYFHQGRANDLFKVNAEWVSPSVVENVLRTHPAVKECAVAGRTVAGVLRPWAFVVPVPGIEQTGELLADMRDHIKQQLPRHMVPVRFVFVEELPKTSTGKIQRFKL